MPTTDRRQTSRTKLDQLAYINIEPDNGGIVLNVSGEGLAFHSMAPVERNGTLRLALQEQNRRIDVCGELVWTDEVQRSGGVRFTNLPAEARDQLLKWTRNSDTAARNTLGSVLLRALPGTDSRRVARSLTPVLAWWKSGTRLKLSGFNRGLATGLLVSLVAFSIVLFSYGHRHEFGESLIRLGKRLAGDSDRTPRPVPPSSVTVSSPPTAPAITTVDARSSLDKAPAVKTAPERKSTYAEARPVVQTPVPPAPRHTEDPPKQPNPGADKTRVANLSGGKGLAPQTTLPTLAAAKPANSGPLQSPISHAPASIAKQQLAPSMDSEAAVTLSAGPSLQSPGSNVQMFYDLGRFKKEELAQILSDKLAQLGMHAAVVHRRNLWMTAYQVLVGPYDNEVAERQISNELLSHGYKPRPFERGTRNFAFRSKLTIDRSQLPTGDFTIAWESYIADAKVRFKQGNSEIAAVDGKWIKRQTKFSHNEYVYRIQADGARPLLEVHFAGMDRALVFRNLP